MNEKKDLLRFTTAGSVDDGKSTLIGRLLYDSKSVFQDQLDAIENLSKAKGYDYVDLSLITDGLKSEREQGITIDVAYRYFETKKRKFIIADTPGHIQYTRNMVTGASTANLAIILIDARKGLLEQTYRHSFISSLLGISHLIVCVNKMDLVNYDEPTYNNIIESYKNFSSKLKIKDVRFIPISALHGENIVKQSTRMPWYNGAPLLNELENVYISSDYNYIDCRFPIQNVIRPHRDNYQDFRGFGGKIEAGIFKTGDEIETYPDRLKSTIKKIFLGEEEVKEAYPPMSIVMTLEDEIDLSRGDMITKPGNSPTETTKINAICFGLSEANLSEKKKIILKHTTQEIKGLISKIEYKIDINTLHREEAQGKIKLNEIGKVQILLSKSIYADTYHRLRSTGSFIIIDPISNETLGAGIIADV